MKTDRLFLLYFYERICYNDSTINSNLAEKIMNRCPWCLINELETKYHDDEWGVPVYDDVKQFEYLNVRSDAMRVELGYCTEKA